MFLAVCSIILSVGVSISLQRNLPDQFLGAMISTGVCALLSILAMITLWAKSFKKLALIPVLFALGDLAYGISVDILKLDYPNQAGCLLYVVPYLGGMFLINQMGVSVLKKLKDKYLNIILGITFMVVFYLCAKAVMVPAIFHKVPALPLYLQALTVLFTVFEAGTIALCVAFLLVTFSVPIQTMLFGCLLMHVSDIALRYQSVDTGLLGMNFFTHGWTIGLTLIVCASIFLGSPLKETKKVLPAFSLRGVFIVAFLLCLGLCAFALSSLYDRSVSLSVTAEHTSSTLLVVSVIYFIAILASNIVTWQLSAATSRIRNATPLKRSKFLPFELGAFEDEVLRLSSRLAGERDKSLKMSAKLAHDVRAPIGTLKLVCDALRQIKDSDEISKEELENCLEIISVANDDIKMLARDILNERKIILDKDCIKGSIGKAVRLVQAESSLNRVSVDICEDLSEVFAPGLTTVLTNLIFNSLEAGGANELVKIVASEDEDEVKISIMDTGKGISAEVLEALKRGDSITTKRNGNGIGLSSAIEWAHLSGLKFSITSAQEGSNRGTKIELGIPK